MSDFVNCELITSHRLSEHSGIPNDTAPGGSTQQTPTTSCTPKVVPKGWLGLFWTHSLLSNSTWQRTRRDVQRMRRHGVWSCHIGKWWTRPRRQTNPVARSRRCRVKSQPLWKRVVPMDNCEEELLGGLERRGAVKIRMSPLRRLVGRRAPSVLSILRRGTISECCPVKASIGSTRDVSTRGYWSFRVHARCAVRVSG